MKNQNILFVTNWSNGNHCVNDRIRSYCNKNNIETRTNHFMQTEIKIKGEWTATDYKYCKQNDILTIIEKERK